MIRWILHRNWLSISLFAVMITLFSSGIEMIAINYIGLVFSATLGVTVLFSRSLPWMALSLFPIAAILLSLFSVNPGLSIVLLSTASFLVSIFGSRLQRTWNIFANLVGALVIGWLVGYQGQWLHTLFAGSNFTELSKVNSLLVLLVITFSLFGFMISFGRLAFLKVEHIGSPKDRAIQTITSENLRLEIAKQNERLEIAKDLSELLVQRISAVVSVTEGGRYAIRADSNAAERVLERAFEASKNAQSELRRLYDYLNSSIFSELATFKISDLHQLSVAYRELGYNTVIEEQGKSFPLNDGMELCVYKIVFEALQNVRKHTPIGTEISISFLWVEDGLQVLIKDNGIEYVNRQKANVGELVEGYSAQDDFESLVTDIDGATLAALRDRAAIYNGRIEATVIPGVGFTLSAIFPQLKSLATEK